jgi:hypothetical protein
MARKIPQKNAKGTSLAPFWGESYDYATKKNHIGNKYIAFFFA